MIPVTSTEAIGALTRRVVDEGGFAEFVRRAWSQVCPEPLVWSWHVEEICQVLEEIAFDRSAGIKRELVVEIPPGMSKSLLVSVLWQPWVWTWWPESIWITCTYEAGLAEDLSGKSLDLVRGDWYQAAWPLGLHRDAMKHWSNSRGGERRAVGTGGAITGKHGHFHVGDDLVKEQDTRVGSAVSIKGTLEKANGFWFGTMITRRIGNVARALVGQRLHVDDTPGEARRRGYEVISLPMHFDSTRADPRDHRTVDGELLCEARYDEEQVQEITESLGPAAAKAQLEQDPHPVGGQLIKDEYLSHRYERLPGRLLAYLEGNNRVHGVVCGIYGDMTFKGKVTSDFTVYQFWAAYLGEYWLIDQVRGQWSFTMAKQQLRDFVAAHPRAHFIKLEDAANAAATEDDLFKEIPGLQVIPHGGGCLARQQRAEKIWVAGLVHLPLTASWMGGAQGFVAEHTGYDGLGTRHDDQVSTSGLALLDLDQGAGRAYSDTWRKALQR